jgi:glycerol kinase
MPELLLAIDVGTTNLGACLFAPNGDLLAQAKVHVKSESPRPGRVEQDAAAIWRATRAIVAQALAEAGRDAADLAAIGVTSQRASAVLWDRQTGKALTPLVVWSDLRGVARARELQALGIPLSPQQAAAKLEGMVAGLRDIPRARLAFGNIDSFLIWKLTGGAAHVTDRSQAWPLGYLSLETFGWNERLMELQGLDAGMFPALCDTWGALGVTTARALGAAVPICADIADQQAALIGQGCEGAGEAKVSYGTSATLDVSTGGAFLYPGPTTPPFVLSSVNGETRFCLEGMVYSAGSALDWLRREFGLGGHGRFEALAMSASDSAGVYVLPAFSGLGAPHGDLARRGVIGGLGAGNGVAHLARAALEGVAFRVREIFDHVYAVTDLPAPDVLKVDGGLTDNDALMQIQADLLARPVARHAHREATACGAAISAGRGAGLLAAGDAAGFVRHDRVFEPRLSADEAAGRLAAWKTQVYGPAA